MKQKPEPEHKPSPAETLAALRAELEPLVNKARAKSVEHRDNAAICAAMANDLHSELTSTHDLGLRDPSYALQRLTQAKKNFGDQASVLS